MLNDKYEIVSKIDEKNGVEIFSVEDQMGKKYITEKYQTSLFSNREILEQYKNKLDILKNFRDEKIINLVDNFSDNRSKYLVFDNIVGESLDKVYKNGDFQITQIWYIGEQLLEIIERFQSDSFKIIHNSITPSNIFIDQNGEIKLTNFENGKFYEKDSGIDLNADQYGLGGVIYYLLTGEIVENGDDIDLNSDKIPPIFKQFLKKMLRDKGELPFDSISLLKHGWKKQEFSDYNKFPDYVKYVKTKKYEGLKFPPREWIDSFKILGVGIILFIPLFFRTDGIFLEYGIYLLSAFVAFMVFHSRIPDILHWDGEKIWVDRGRSFPINKIDTVEVKEFKDHHIIILKNKGNKEFKLCSSDYPDHLYIMKKKIDSIIREKKEIK